MSGQTRVRPPHAAHATARPSQPTPWRGLGGLLSLAVIVAPMVVMPLPSDMPNLFDGGGPLVPLGVVIALIIAVFRAGQQMQKLTDKLTVLDKLVARVTVLEQRVGIEEAEPAE